VGNLIKSLTEERCPVCGKKLVISDQKWMKSMYVKSCPEGHIKKEVYPHLQTTIEYKKNSPEHR